MGQSVSFETTSLEEEEGGEGKVLIFPLLRRHTIISTFSILPVRYFGEWSGPFHSIFIYQRIAGVASPVQEDPIDSLASRDTDRQTDR